MRIQFCCHPSIIDCMGSEYFVHSTNNCGIGGGHWRSSSRITWINYNLVVNNQLVSGTVIDQTSKSALQRCKEQYQYNKQTNRP